MNLIDFFVNMHNRDRGRGWVETTATFTGQRCQAAVHTRTGYKEVDYYQYEITYYVGEKTVRSWYTFNPLPDPDPEEIAGQTVRVRYNKRRPFISEHIVSLALLLFALPISMLTLSGCGAEEPVTMDYSLSQNWAYVEYSGDEDMAEDEEMDKPADVFFVCPSVVHGDEEHLNMDVTDPDQCGAFINAINMEKGIYDGNTRFYAPFYRQATLAAYNYSEEYREQFLQSAYLDVRAAFDYYMTHYNDGRPVILAGFSQGADHVKRLLVEYGDDAFLSDKLVAAYVIGWNMTDSDLRAHPYLQMAQAETDTGVIVSFCSEAENVSRTTVVPSTTNGINPLNWKTDETLAEKNMNQGACFMKGASIVNEIPELTGAYLDPERGTLKVVDVSPEDYPAGIGSFVEGNYHIYDYQFFYRNLQSNVPARINEFLAEQKIIDRDFGDKDVYGHTSLMDNPEEEKTTDDAMYYAKNVCAEMLDAKYWLEYKPLADEPIMDAEAIQELAEEMKPTNPSIRSYYAYVGDSRKTTIDAGEMVEILSEIILPRDNTFYLDGTEVDEEFWTEVMALRGIEEIADTNKVRYGVTTEDAYVRLAPSNQELSSGFPYDYCDAMQNSSLRINEPVIVINESTDGEFCYILSRFCGGWVDKSKLGVTDDYNYWYESTNPEDFIVVMDNHAYLDVDAEDESISQKELSMGVRLAVCDSDEPAISLENRYAINNYMVQIPCADKNGRLIYKTGRIPGYIKVHHGYLDYTQRNVLELAFGCLGERYGWGGQYGARDCSAYVMDIYRCFGIELPRNTSGMMGIPHVSMKIAGMSDDEKHELLDNMPAGAILLFPGHVMLYLGQRDGHYYCISATGSMMMDGYESAVRVSSVLVNTLDTRRASGKTWLESLNYIKVIM